jgi:hypothetical protein
MEESREEQHLEQESIEEQYLEQKEIVDWMLGWLMGQNNGYLIYTQLLAI